MHLKTVHRFAIFGLRFFCTSASPVTRRGDHEYNDIDLNAVFDGTLGTLPALWLVSQGALAGFKSANSTHNIRRQEDQERTDLENGGVMAAFIATMLTLPVKMHDENPMHGFCEALLSGASVWQAP